MIGKYQIRLGAEQLISGMSSSDFATDGALGTASTGLNPFVTPGVIRPISSPVDLSTNVLSNIIASAEDSQTTSSYNRTFIDSAGNYYGYSAPSTVTKLNTATTNAAFYTAGVVDMVAFAGNTYVTTANGDIDRWLTSGPTLTNSWWVGTKSQSSLNSLVPHPMIPYQGSLYIADANKLDTVASDSSTIALGVLTLNTNEFIYAMAIDPVTGLLMLSVQTVVNIGDALSSRFFVYLYDGISAKATRKIPTDDLITAFHNIEGTVYVMQGVCLGVWNGNGVTFLRKLMNASFTSTDLAYKHHITNTRNILHVIDGASVLSYGAAVSGKKAFFYTAFNPSGSGHLSCIMPMGFSNQFAIAYATNKLAKFDVADTSAGTASLSFNNTYFDRPVYIRRMRIVTTGVGATSGFGDGSVSFFDEKENNYVTQVSTFVNQTGSTKYVFDYDYTQAKVQAVQPRINIDTLNWGIVRVYIYYDIAE